MRKNIRHFKKKEIDYAKYIKDFYLDNGIAYISCSVRSIEDVINPYSVKGYEDLNPELANYIEENAYHIPVEYPIVLEICGGSFSPAEKKVIEETVLDHFGLKLGDAQLDLSQNRANSLRLLVLGLASFALFFILGKLDVLGTVLDFAFWFFIWEFGDMVWLTRNELLENKTAAAQLASLKIVFRKKI
ncbi:MAG: hypothetical protein PHD67_06280 [Oscillospiraceae bacterium]|nr:hypothetical protein [Oscillospiraceae bacterium]